MIFRSASRTAARRVASHRRTCLVQYTVYEKSTRGALGWLGTVGLSPRRKRLRRKLWMDFMRAVPGNFPQAHHRPRHWEDFFWGDNLLIQRRTAHVPRGGSGGGGRGSGHGSRSNILR